MSDWLDEDVVQRVNDLGAFSTIYLAQPAATAASEFKRMAFAAGMPPQAMIANGYELHTLEVRDLAVLDLRAPGALQSVGLDAEDISDRDWTACQSLGHAAWFLEMGGVLAPSASGAGLVLAAFDSRLRPGQVRHADSRPFDAVTYEDLMREHY